MISPGDALARFDRAFEKALRYDGGVFAAEMGVAFRDTFDACEACVLADLPVGVSTAAVGIRRSEIDGGAARFRPSTGRVRTVARYRT